MYELFMLSPLPAFAQRTEHRHVPVEIPGVRSVAPTVVPFGAGQALTAALCSILPESPESVEPHVRESVRADIPLDERIPPLDVEAGEDIAVAEYAAHIDA